MTLEVLPNSPTLPISESFVSIQGEGTLVGVPSYFLRVSGCNLRCVWCDTPYASWNPTIDGRGGGNRTIDDLVTEARASTVNHAVLTGGEPMMFKQLCELTSRLSAPREKGGAGMHITIETAGTIIPRDDNWPLICDLMSISPKLSTSTPHDDVRDPGDVWSKRHEERRLNIPVLQELLDRWPRAQDGVSTDRQLKFVLSAETEAFHRDMAEIEEILGKLRAVSPADVLLMPEGVAPPTSAHKALLITACLKRGYRYCPRLHIELFGNRRGT